MKYKILIGVFMFFLIFLCGNQVFGFTIVLDPGHGGTEPGSIAENGELEKNLNLKIARYLRDYLSNYDVDVYMTHNGFSGYEYSVFDRAMFAREKKADLVLSLHLNSSDVTAEGAEIWVTGNTSLDKYNKNMTSLGNKILNNLGNLGIKSRGVQVRYRENDPTELYSDGSKADFYGIICWCMRGCKIDNGVISPEEAVPAKVEKGEGVPAAIVEHCFLKGSDYKYVNTEEGLRKIAIADGQAVVEQYGLSKKREHGDTPFQDIYKDDWYYSAVKYNYENGMILGTTSTTFAPTKNLTRGMLATILYRMEGTPAVTGTSKFSDVNNNKMYYYSAVTWAADNKIVNGYNNGKFGPDNMITRQDLAVILRNYAIYKGNYTKVTANLTTFKDGNLVSDYAKTAMQWAVGKGVITGNSNTNTLSPHGKATRAETASMLYKYCTKIK